MADLLANETKYWVADPFDRTKTMDTETGGKVNVKNGWVTNKETAAEIKDKNPHFVVSTVEGIIPKGRTLFTVPALPWHKEKKYGQKP